MDYLLESTSAAAVLLAGLGRFVQDLLLWGTAEFSYVRFGDGYVQRSSIMPQKRNPVAVEHARAIGSKALGQAQAIVTTVHNTPFGDIVDTEDDLQPLVFAMFRDATRAVKLVASGFVFEHHFHRHVEARRHLGLDLAAPNLEARPRHLIGANPAERLALLARDPLGQVFGVALDDFGHLQQQRLSLGIRPCGP